MAGVGSGWPCCALSGPGAVFVPKRSVGSGTKSSRPVEPTSLRMESGSLTPGISTTIRSVPCVCTIGSETPVAFTRRSTMSLIVARSDEVGDFPPAGSAW